MGNSGGLPSLGKSHGIMSQGDQSAPYGENGNVQQIGQLL